MCRYDFLFELSTASSTYIEVSSVLLLYFIYYTLCWRTVYHFVSTLKLELFVEPSKQSIASRSLKTSLPLVIVVFVIRIVIGICPEHNSGFGHGVSARTDI
jgi:hypothetical protein